MAPAGRAFLKGAPYTPRTRAQRGVPAAGSPRAGPSSSSTPAPRPAARARWTRRRPTPGSSSHPADAGALGIIEGDWVRVESPRGAIEVRARLGRVMPGAVFAPFHYGHWDPDDLAPTPTTAQPTSSP